MAATMARASANSTSEARERWRARMRDPNYRPPVYTPARDKPIGSRELVLGRWVEVKGDQ